MMMAPPSATISWATCSERFAPAVERSTGTCLVACSSQPRAGTLNRPAFARKCGARFWLYSMWPTTSGSISVQWLGAAINPPAGSFSVPSHFLLIMTVIKGRTTPAMNMNVALLLADSFTLVPLLRGGDVEVGAQSGQLFGEALVAPVDDVDSRNPGGSRSGEGRNQVAETAAEVRHVDVGSLELGRAGDHCGVQEVPLAEPARHAA